MPEDETPADEIPTELVEAVAAALFRSADPVAGIDQLCAEHPHWSTAIRALAAVPDSVRESLGSTIPSAPRPVGIGEARPEQIGPYRIVAVLGEGGMGTVYRAHQEQPVEREVALKVIKFGMDSREVLARFDLERRALAAMSHGSIARVFDAGTTERGQPYFVMEFVEGLPITDYCDQHGLGLRERIELLREVCAGVQHAHQKGIIHRDLKPGNVLVTREGERAVPKILDFGLAKATKAADGRESSFTLGGQVMGTPEYMAPEQADGRSVLDTRVDVYSLGVILYELLAGELPFSSKELRLVGWAEVQRVLHEVEPPKPSSRVATTVRGTIVARELRGDLDWIVMKTLSKEPERRYASPDGLAEDLHRFLTHQPVDAGPPSARYRLGKLVRRYRGAFAASAVVLVTLVVGIVAFAIENRRAAQNERAALLRADVARSGLVRLVETVQNQLGDIPLGKVRAARAQLLREARDDLARLAGDEWFRKGGFSRKAEFGALRSSAWLAVQDDDREDAARLLEAAVALGRELAREQPVAIVVDQLARALLLDATVRRRFGDREGALRSLEEAEQRLRAVEGHSDVRLFDVLLARGDTQVDALDHGAAGDSYREAVAIGRNIKASSGDEQRLAQALSQLSRAVQDGGDFAGALKLVDESVATYRVAVARDPYSGRALRGLASTLFRRVMLLSSRLRHARDALKSCLEAGEIWRRLIEMDADDLKSRTLLGRCLSQAGGLQRKLRQNGEARATLDEAISICTEALARDAGDRLAFSAVGRACTERGMLAFVEKDSDKTRALIDDYAAIAARSSFAGGEYELLWLNDAKTVMGLCSSHHQLVGGAVPAEAIAAFERIEVMAEKSESLLRHYTDALVKRAQMHARAAEFDQERIYLERYLEIVEGSPDPSFDTPFQESFIEAMRVRLKGLRK